MSRKKIQTIGCIVKHKHEAAASLAKELVHVAWHAQKKIVFANESRALAKRIQKGTKKTISILPKKQLITACDLILVLGGDGTFLSIARLMEPRSIPLVGINLGRLGFLTEIKQTEAILVLESLLELWPPTIIIRQRPLLSVRVKRGKKIIFSGLVVNDAVISKGAIARIIGLDIWVNNSWVNNIRADGLILSTTTGSTAYALAAGGPILDPALEGLVLAPICAHSLTLRPLVLPDTVEIRIKLVDRPGHVYLTLDGQDAFDLKENDEVFIERFTKHNLQIIGSPNRDFFALLREKLKFGARE